jgi:CBS domain containing-hemolysin-like protein
MPSWYLFLALLFILANGFFVAAEFAIIRVRPTQLAEIAAEGSTRARMARRITRRLDSYLSATQLGVTLMSLALGWVGEPAFESLIHPRLMKLGIMTPGISHSIAATIAFTLITVLHIIIGELGPKYIAIDKTLPTALAVAHPLRAFHLVMYPAIFILNRLSNVLLSAVGIKPASEGEMAHSQEELRIILASSEKAGVLSEENREIIEGVFQFSKRTAKQIMVPRTDVVILSTTKSIQENLDIIHKTRHTRYPL